VPPYEPTISDIERTVQNGLEALRGAPLSEEIAAALKFLTPPGYRPIAQLEEDGRKKRSNAAASNWNPATGEIVIYFERMEIDSTSSIPLRRQSADSLDFESRLRKIREQKGLSNDPYVSESTPTLGDRDGSQDFDPKNVTPWQLQQCCEALADVEKEGKAFVALKWFRDQGLTAHGYPWASSLACRQAVLAQAIAVGAVLTSSIPNPKAPQHPTTTVKLNRESEYALSVAPRYQPIRAVGGASASEIVLRDRGRF